MDGECEAAQSRKGDAGVDGDGADLWERSVLPWRCGSAVRCSILAKSGGEAKMVAVAAAIAAAIADSRDWL